MLFILIITVPFGKLSKVKVFFLVCYRQQTRKKIERITLGRLNYFDLFSSAKRISIAQIFWPQGKNLCKVDFECSLWQTDNIHLLIFFGEPHFLIKSDSVCCNELSSQPLCKCMFQETEFFLVPSKIGADASHYSCAKYFWYCWAKRRVSMSHCRWPLSHIISVSGKKWGFYFNI